jgi:hypothetical protein
MGWQRRSSDARNASRRFIDPKWDLMYFVEVIDDRGRGRMLPDLDKETPYVVVSVPR